MSPSRSAVRRFVVVVAAAVLGCVVPGLSGPGAGSPAAAATSTNSPAGITGVGSGRCLDVLGVSKAKGTGVDVWDCNHQVNQKWSYTAAGELTVYDASTCLDVESYRRTPGARVEIWPCTGGGNQKWKLNPDGTVTGVDSGLCLEVAGARTAAGSLVQLGSCTGAPDQQWQTSLGPADRTPPSAPGSPQVSALTCSSVRLSWSRSTDDVGVVGYDLYHDGQQIGSVAGSVTEADLKVVAGVRWGLYVNARDAAGNVSQASSTVYLTPPLCGSDTQPPTTPGTPVATVRGTSVSLTWAASGDNVGVKTYQVYRDAVPAGSITGSATVPPVAAFTDSALAASTTYRYTVLAVDAQGNTSARSAAATVTTGAACAGPVCAVGTVATDTDLPWGLLTLPDGSVLYSRRDAHDLIRLDPRTGAKTTVGTVPNVVGTDGEGGLLGIAIAPTFDTDRWLYVMHTSPTDNRIVRIRLTTAGTLDQTSEQVLLRGIDKNKFHNGGRLRFGPDGKLYASTGDAQNGDNAQNVNSLNGKVLRLNPDGSVPGDNPFGNAVWSYGHRNPQGLAFDSRGRLWEQEFGNGVMDETNLIVRGGNYGWPACEGTSGTCTTPGYLAPKHTYSVVDGSCSGIAIVRDVLYVACERGTRMYREVISGDSLTGVEVLFAGTYGRLRTVEPAADGGLWLTTSNQGDKDSTADNSNEKILHLTLGP